MVSLAVASPAMAQSATAAASGKAPGLKAAFPAMRMDGHSNGEKAIAKLGANLPAVAAYYGKKPEELSKILRTDKSAWLDHNGRMFYVEPMMNTAPTNLAPSNAIYPLTQTFALHSRPGSKRKIYLDFNGSTTTDSEWNRSYGVGTIVSAPFDMDGVPGSFNADELAKIQNVWRAVAEDYAPFDVDVTTEEPPFDHLLRMLSGDETYGVQAIITPSNFTTGTARDCGGCLGIAYIGSFDDNFANKPAFTFAPGYFSAQVIADIVSHEVGHTLGLNHDGTHSAAYYSGHSTPYGGWSPIMGSVSGYAVTQFSRGEYANANNVEDDYGIMQNHGVWRVGDDFGNTNATARALTGTYANNATTYDVRGLIETPTDVDVFRFAASPGLVTITAAPFEIAPNLDILMEVRDINGTLLASVNPAESLNSAVSVWIPAAGNYFVSVQGVGDQGNSLHWSDYGSIGRYSMRVTAPINAAPPTCNIAATVYRSTASTRISVSGAGSTDSFGPMLSYNWSWDDGMPNSTGVTSGHSYFETGTYVTTLTVTSASGMTNSCRYTTNVSVTGPYR